MHRLVNGKRVEMNEAEAETFNRSRPAVMPADVKAARETLRRLDRELCDGCEALMEHIGPEQLPRAQRERLEVKREARETIRKYEEG